MDAWLKDVLGDTDKTAELIARLKETEFRTGLGPLIYGDKPHDSTENEQETTK